MSRNGKLRLAVLISGRGSNLLAIAQACRDGRLDASIALAPTGVTRNLLKMPCSRNVTSCTLNPQKLPMTVNARTSDSR